MKTQKILAFFLSLVVLCHVAQAQNQKPSTDDARLARLSGLAKAWGAVKYFHPFLAYRDIDWDKALIDAIPKVNAARSPQEYEAAINQMLAVLNDKSTRAEIEAAKKPEPTSTAPANHVRTENGIVVIDVTSIATTVAKNTDALGGLVGKVNEALPKATGVVFDARSNSKIDELDAYFFDLFMRQTLPSLLDSDLTLGSGRYRMHNGYATQTGSGAQFYSSAFLTSSPQVIEGRSKTKTPPIVFVINQHSPAFTEILSGMQSARRALIIQDGEHAPETGGSSYTLDLPDDIKVRLRTSELINPDGSLGLQPDAVLQTTANDDPALQEAIKAVQEKRTTQRTNKPTRSLEAYEAEKDKTYADMSFPPTEYRLLGLFRFWNVINYFFPYKSLIDKPWDSVLPRYIPKFEANMDQADYQFTVRELVAEIQDSHGGVRNANAANEKIGMFQPPFILGYREEKSVVTKVLDDKLPVKVGDVVLTIDGEPVEKRREFLSRYVATSTPQWLMRAVHFRLPVGQKDSLMKLRVRGADGTERDVELQRSLSLMDPKLFASTQRTTPVMQVLPSGYGYVDLARLQAGEVDKMFETIKNTPAVIFDMRGYPNGTAWSIAPRLTEKKNLVAALFSRPFLEGPSMSSTEYAESANYSFSQKLPEAKGDVYKGKVVMLINEDAISQSEHTCMFFEVATDVTFIGTPTAGANGDITFMVMPGNLPVSFTGHNVRHADGRQLQRVGIQPHIKVAPTIRGMREGRDEILEAAIEFLQKSLKKD